MQKVSRFIVKPEIRLLGIDDAPFGKTDKEVLLVGTVFRGGQFLDGVVSTTIAKDGDDATEKIAALVTSSHHDKLRGIFLNGITFGGFNVVDLPALSQTTGLPVIAVVRHKPDLEKIKKVLERFPPSKWTATLAAGQLHRFGPIYFQFAGSSITTATELLKVSTTRSHIPEPLRAAHLIAAGVVKGESRGRA